MPKAQREMYTTLPEMAMRPADAYDKLVRGRVESVEIDDLMGRTLAVMVVPYPPGIPLIMPGERITQATKSIQDYLLYAREFDRKFPGFETDIHGLRFEPADEGRRYLVDCVVEGGRADDPARRQIADRPDPVPQAAEDRRDRRPRRSADEGASRPYRRPRTSRSKCATAYDRDVSEDADVGAYIALVDGDASRTPASFARSRPRASASRRRSGRSPIRTASPTWRCST